MNLTEQSFRATKLKEADQIRSRFPALVFVKEANFVAVIGGMDQSVNTLKTVSVYHIEKDQWEVSPQNLKLARRSLAACVVQDYVYAVCGQTERGATNTIERIHYSGLIPTDEASQAREWDVIIPD